MHWPIPEPAPVTSATLLSRRMSFLLVRLHGPDLYRRAGLRTGARISRSLQVGVGADEDFDELCLGLVVALQPLAERCAQMIERGFDERRQFAAVLAFEIGRASCRER